jgi:hypothetical protein
VRHGADELTRVNEWLRQLVGMNLNQMCLGVGDLQLNFSGAAIQVEAPITFKPAHYPHAVHEPSSMAAMHHLRPLLNRELDDARVADDKTLVLRFGDITLEVRPDPAYEAWNLTLEQPGARVFCTAGGDLSIFSDG